MIATLVLFVFASCGEDETAPVPVAEFSYEVDSENPLMVSFTNTSQDAETYSWDFGDGNTSEEMSPSHTYGDEGTYSVKLTASGAGGSNEFTSELSLVIPEVFGLQAGDMSDDSFWTVISHNANSTGILTIEEGVATWSATADNAWGNEAHMGMYQAINLEAGTYSTDLNITLNGVSEIWFEVYIGPNEPVSEADYNADNGATQMIAHSAWDCANNNTYSGSLADVNCAGDNTFTVSATGTYYYLIRSGGINFGEGGIVVDDVVLNKE